MKFRLKDIVNNEYSPKLIILDTPSGKTNDDIVKFKESLNGKNIKTIELDMDDISYSDAAIYVAYLDAKIPCDDEELLSSKTYNLFEQSKIVDFNGTACFEWIPPKWWPSEPTVIFFKNFRNKELDLRLIKRLIWMITRYVKPDDPAFFNRASSVVIVPVNSNLLINLLYEKYPNLEDYIAAASLE